MPYYHVYVNWKDEIGARWSRNRDLSIVQINEIVKSIKKKMPFILGKIRVDPSNITKLEIWKTEARASKRPNMWDWISFYGENVTNDFIITLPTRPKKEETEEDPSRETKKILSKNVFIVHGRDHKPMKELKAMLKQFGLNPIVLHEQPSGSRTIVEKLEKYSDVGYAFVILTPDDIGGDRHRFDSRSRKVGVRIIEEYSERARQNVILEFGYFIGKLGRDKVCCLHKGDVELPSDMHGMVYIPFKQSVNEVKDKVVKELKAAGYEIRI